jgi:hypothetical protein
MNIAPSTGLNLSVQKAGGKASCTLLLHDVSERESIRISKQSSRRDYLKSPENIARTPINSVLCKYARPAFQMKIAKTARVRFKEFS